jgi:hypothetical protein
MVMKAAKIRNICKHIFEIGKLDEDKLACVVLLHALSSDLRYIRDKQEDNETSTAADIVQSLEKAKMCWEEETKRDTKERANTARTAAKTPAQAKNSKSTTAGPRAAPWRAGTTKYLSEGRHVARRKTPSQRINP